MKTLQYNITKTDPIEVNPTKLEIEVLGKSRNELLITIRQIEPTPYGRKMQEETKPYPESFAQVITGYDIETDLPIVNIAALQTILDSFGITIVI